MFHSPREHHDKSWSRFCTLNCCLFKCAARQTVWNPVDHDSDVGLSAAVYTVSLLLSCNATVKPRPQQAARSNATSRTILSTKSKQIVHVQFVSILSLERTKFHEKLVRHCCRFFSGNEVERCIEIVAGVNTA